MREEVLSRALRVGRILPAHLTEAGERAPEVREIQPAGRVVVRQVARLRAVRSRRGRRRRPRRGARRAAPGSTARPTPRPSDARACTIEGQRPRERPPAGRRHSAPPIGCSSSTEEQGRGQARIAHEPTSARRGRDGRRRSRTVRPYRNQPRAGCAPTGTGARLQARAPYRWETSGARERGATSPRGGAPSGRRRRTPAPRCGAGRTGSSGPGQATGARPRRGPGTARRRRAAGCPSRPGCPA